MGKNCRTISLNSTYIVVFKNLRDQSQIRHLILACQIFPSKPKFLQVAYEDATKDPYWYLFFDFHPNSPEFAKVRGKIFLCDLLDDPCCLYLPKRHANLDVYKRTHVFNQMFICTWIGLC